MAAGRKDAGKSQPVEHLTLVALYEREEAANELLERLQALHIDTSDATIIRVDLDQHRREIGSAPAPSASSFSPILRGMVTGGLIASAAALLIGLGLYEAELVKLPFVEGLFGHVLAATVAGAAVGAALGAAIASVRQKKQLLRPAPAAQPASSDGFLVVIKTPPRLAEQAEAIARRLGAKEIIL